MATSALRATDCASATLEPSLNSTVAPGCFLDALRNAHAIWRCSAVPVKKNLICPGAYHCDGLQFRAIEWKRMVLVLQQNDRLICCLTHQFPGRSTDRTAACVPFDSRPMFAYGSTPGRVHLAQVGRCTRKKILERVIHVLLRSAGNCLIAFVSSGSNLVQKSIDAGLNGCR